jgi:class 3 adenylate cyclase
MTDFSGYATRWLRQRLARPEWWPLRPEMECLGAVVLCADITGFTKTAQDFQRQGAGGVEALASIINAYLGRLIALVQAWGGDVENLYGDSIIAFWSFDDGRSTRAMALASACAREIIQGCDNFPVNANTRFRVRVVISEGSCFGLQVGGYRDQWLFCLGGQTLRVIERMLRQAGSGTILAGGSLIDVSPPDAISAQSVQPEDDPAAPATALAKFVPKCVRSRTQRSISGWFAEFREVTILCVGAPDLQCRSREDLGDVQRLVRGVQEVVARYDGEVLQFAMSEKGPMVLAAYGLHDQSHEDDAARGLLTGMEIVRARWADGLQLVCSVASGTGFCGQIGSPSRHEYRIVGEVVNNAAKTLAHVPPLDVVCDEATSTLAVEQVQTQRFVEIAPNVWTPLFRAVGRAKANDGPIDLMLGRREELSTLLEQFNRLSRGDRVKAVVVQGPPGIGKSALVSAFREHIEGRSVCICARADPLTGQTTPYGPWVSVVAELLAAYPGDGLELSRRVVASVLQRGLPEASADLVKIVLPSLAQHGEMPPIEEAAVATREAVLAFVLNLLGNRKLVLLFEDVQWIDDASRQLGARLVAENGNVLWMSTLRNDGASQAEEWLEGATRITLGALPGDEMRELIRRVLGRRGEVDEYIVARIEARAEGNPFFARQLALDWRASQDGAVPSPVDALANLPDSISRAIIARYDRFSSRSQLLLKGASVIGPWFEPAALAAVLAEAIEPDEIGSGLAELSRYGIVRVDSRSSGGLWQFEHALPREAVYRLIPPAIRGRLHARCAEFLESDERRPYPAHLLAYHWTEAKVPMRALPYLDVAATTATRSGAYREAAKLLEHAVHAAETLDFRTLSPQKADLHHRLGDMYLLAGEVDKSAASLFQALGHCGHPWPQTRVGTAIALAGQIGLQAWRARDAVGCGDPNATAWPTRLRPARVFESLGQVMGHKSDVLGMALATVSALNICQRYSDVAGYTRAAGLVSLMLHLAGLLKLGDWYFARTKRYTADVTAAHDRLMCMEYLALHWIGKAQFDNADRELNDMIALGASSNNLRRALDATSLLIIARILQGRPEACIELADRLGSESIKIDDPQLRCWCALERAELAVLGQDLEEATRQVAIARILRPRVRCTEHIWTDGIDALVHLLQDDLASAISIAARNSPAVLRNWRATPFYAYAGIFGTAEVILRVLETAPVVESDQRAALARDAGAYMRVVKGFSERVPVLRPRGRILIGRYESLRGRKRSACRYLDAAVRLSVSQERPREQLVAHAALAGLDVGSSAAREHAAAAYELRSSLGVNHDVLYLI